MGEVVDGKIFLIGLPAAVQIYDPVSDSWSLGSPMPTGRQEMASAVVNGLIYVAGGTEANIVTSSALEVYDPAANSWDVLAPMPVPLSALGGGRIGDEFCVFGGRLANPGPTGDAFPETYCYDPSTDSWRQGPDMITPRVLMASVELGEAAYAISGRLGDGLVDAVERLRY